MLGQQNIKITRCSVLEVWAYTDFFMSIKTNSIYGIYGMEYQLRAANDNDFLYKEKKTLSL